MKDVSISSSIVSRINNIELYAKKQQEKMDNEKRRQEEKFASLNKEIEALYQMVFDIISVANTCLKCNVRIEDFRRKDVHECIPVAFDIQNNKIMLGIYNDKNTRISLYAGPFGLCNWDGVSVSAIKDNVNVIGYIPAMESFLKGFDSFEERFYKYVDHFIEVDL